MNQITFLIALFLALLFGLYIIPEKINNTVLSKKINKKQEEIVLYVLNKQLQTTTNIINNLNSNIKSNNKFYTKKPSVTNKPI